MKVHDVGNDTMYSWISKHSKSTMIICKDRGNLNFSAENSEGRRSESTVGKRGRR